MTPPTALQSLLGSPDLVVEVVDIGANPIDGDPPYLPLLRSGGAQVTGFEPQPEALSRLQSAAGPKERYLPYAVGDGDRHELAVCAESGFTSLLEPDQAQLAALIDFPRMARVLERAAVQTVRLDDIAEITRLDYLKIDVQGGELAIFQSGARLLSETVAVQTEVNFFRLYQDQPTFAEVDLFLRSIGFVPQRFVAVKTWPQAPIPWADPLQVDARQLVEADVLYVRDIASPAALALLDDEQLRRLAIVAHTCYGAVGIALVCVRELVRRTVLSASSESAYRALALTDGGHQPPQ